MKLWLSRLKSVVYDIDDLLDEVAFDALQRRVNEGHFLRQLWYYLSSSNPLIFSFNLSRKVGDLRENVERIVAMNNDFRLTERPVERSVDDDKRIGMGRIGKTALAKLVYYDVNDFDVEVMGSIILCTTRNRQVASRIGTIVAYDLNYLPDDFCWSLFKQHAFYEGERNYQNLQEIGWSIVKKCGGIPLIDRSLSTNFVPYMWSALGLLPQHEDIEASGYSYFMKLVSNSLVQVPISHYNGIYCASKMHSILHHLAVKILGEELAVVTFDKLAVTEFTRHIVWGRCSETSDSFKNKIFPQQLRIARNAPTFRFGDTMKKRTNIISMWDDANVGHLSSLRTLNIIDCPKLTCLPNNIKSLRDIQLRNCESLNLEKGEGLQGLCSLHVLSIENLKLVRRLPIGQTTAASLKQLIIRDCSSLIELPADRFTSLKEISISDCPNLSSLPTTFRHLTSLQRLYIERCSLLSTRYNAPNGKDYSLVRHIPGFRITW
ncbi:putative disease resistance protein RGA4 [Spinacia oleracea]|uniref:Disease resistance protein RGA4 n=1 Tax=Spinacia oleracea TaxID=3562 RepID=A0ABM3RH97_SPIOL|nr:putative disease resistance protein RGA4 [Spinacia oleracea]